MRLDGRLTRLEAAQRARRALPCRWHQGVVIYPPSPSRGADGRVPLPPCESPATCPGPSGGQIFLPERRALDDPT